MGGGEETEGKRRKKSRQKHAPLATTLVCPPGLNTLFGTIDPDWFTPAPIASFTAVEAFEGSRRKRSDSKTSLDSILDNITRLSIEEAAAAKKSQSHSQSQSVLPMRAEPKENGYAFVQGEPETEDDVIIISEISSEMEMKKKKRKKKKKKKGKKVEEGEEEGERGTVMEEDEVEKDLAKEKDEDEIDEDAEDGASSGSSRKKKKKKKEKEKEKKSMEDEAGEEGDVDAEEEDEAAAELDEKAEKKKAKKKKKKDKEKRSKEDEDADVDAEAEEREKEAEAGAKKDKKKKDKKKDKGKKKKKSSKKAADEGQPDAEMEQEAGGPVLEATEQEIKERLEELKRLAEEEDAMMPPEGEEGDADGAEAEAAGAVEEEELELGVQFDPERQICLGDPIKKGKRVYAADKSRGGQFRRAKVTAFEEPATYTVSFGWRRTQPKTHRLDIQVDPPKKLQKSKSFVARVLSKKDACDLAEKGDVNGLLEALTANPGLIDKPGGKEKKTPLYYACKAGHVEIVKLLLRFGAEDDEDGDILEVATSDVQKELLTFGWGKVGKTA